MKILDTTKHIGNENITLPSPQPVSFIIPCLSKNIPGFVYMIKITTNTYINIDIYNGFLTISRILMFIYISVIYKDQL